MNMRRLMVVYGLFFIISGLFPAAGQPVTSIGSMTIRYRSGEGFVAYDKQGERLFVVFPFENGPDYPSEGLLRIVKKGKIGFADTSGKIVIRPRFTAVMPFHGGRAAFCKGCRIVHYGEHSAWEGGKWGFIDRKGKVVIPPEYDSVLSGFQEGKAEVVHHGRRVIIGPDGKRISAGGSGDVKLP